MAPSQVNAEEPRAAPPEARLGTAPLLSGELGFSNRRAQLSWFFMYVCDRVCSPRSTQHRKVGTSKAEQTLLSPINSSRGNGPIILPGPGVMSINASVVQAGG